MNVTDWLLDSDPSIRWQVMRDLTDASADAVAAERSKIALEGYGARLLNLQAADGQWGGGTYAPPYTSTTFTLLLLRTLGLDPDSEEARRAVALVRENSRWEYDENLKFFEGEVEPCINGEAVAIGAYFGEDVRGIVDRLLGEQMADGGWNCEQERGSTRGSFNTTIAVLEGLLEYERSTGDSRVTPVRLRGHEYLLERRMLRRLSTGDVIDPAFARFSFPTYFYYDVLRGLDYLRSAGVAPDQRAAEAVDLVSKKRDESGRWALENSPRPRPWDPKGKDPGVVHFQIDEGDGKPSRWNTLRALRVLRWWEEGRR
jgi:hypothetical protein